MQVEIIPLSEKEIGLLRDLTYEAVFIPDGARKPDRSIIEQPELAVY